MYMQSQSIHVNGISLHATKFSQSGEPLLMLHPGGHYSSFVWNSVIPHLADRYQLIAMDLRGHGLSDRPASGYELDTMALDILGVLDALSMKRVHIIGNSLGGNAATRFASLFPERVLSLIHIDTGMINFLGPDGEHDTTKEEYLQSLEQRSIFQFESREAYIRWEQTTWLPWSDRKQRIVEDQPLYRLENGRLAFQQPNEILLQVMASVCDMRLEEWYPAVACPVLFLPAEREPNLEKKLAFIDKVTPHLPYCKTVVIPDSEHVMMIDHANELCAELIRFHQEISR